MAQGESESAVECMSIERIPLPSEVESNRLWFSLSAKWLLDGEQRFDATAYAHGAIHALDLIEKAPVIKTRLARCVSRIYHPTENQPRSNFRRIWVDAHHGTPFLSGRQLFHFRPEINRYISNQLPKIHELRVPVGTILLTRSGTLGIPVLVGERLSRFAVTDDALRIFAGTVPYGYVYAFLASQYGYALIARNAYGSTVEHLEARHLGQIPVPMADGETQQEIHGLIVEAYRLRDHANDLFDQADKRLHEVLGLEPFDEKDVEYLGAVGDPKAFTISAAELGVRLDAAHHVPVSRSAINKLERCRYPLIKLGALAGGIYLAPRFARVYVPKEHGKPFLQGSHVPMSRIYDMKYISNSQTDRMERWIISSNTVLVTCSGTIGRIAVASDSMNGWAASQHILRISPAPNKSHEGYIATFLATPYGQHQLQSKIYGGVVDELTAEDTAEVLIPDIPYSDQKSIGAPARAAYELRDRANALEDQAIARMESLIEGNR